MAKKTHISGSRRPKNQGLFVSFEGGEGAGKSTQMRHLVGWLKENKVPHVVTLEPGGTRLGRGIRELLLNPKNKELSDRTELLLYEADRAQHVAEVIRPALSARKVVVSDRFSDSSAVYQGICRGLGLAWTERLNAFATGGLFPDLVFLLDIPVEVGFSRVAKRFVSDPKLKGKRRVIKLDRLEREKRSFHLAVRKGFLTLARRHPSRFRVIDATLPELEIRQRIIGILEKRLNQK